MLCDVSFEWLSVQKHVLRNEIDGESRRPQVNRLNEALSSAYLIEIEPKQATPQVLFRHMKPKNRYIKQTNPPLRTKVLISANSALLEVPVATRLGSVSDNERF